MADDERTQPQDRAATMSARFLEVAENTVQALVGVMLVVAAVVVLIAVAYRLAVDLNTGASKAVAEAINGLLTVFIVLELLAGLRATLVKKELVAEPFLVVGIIASIRGVIVVALDTKSATGQAFREGMVQIGVLGALALALSIAAYLIRRKEREPEEE